MSKKFTVVGKSLNTGTQTNHNLSGASIDERSHAVRQRLKRISTLKLLVLPLPS